MKHRWMPCCTFALAALLIFDPLVFGENPSSSGRSSFRPGLEFEYGSRTVGWTENDQESTSKMSFWLAGFVLEYRIQPGFSVAARVGYTSTSFEGLTFRRLPLSIAFEAGGISGLLLGAEVTKSLYAGESYGVDVIGQFLASVGFSKKWDIPGLAVEGSVQGKPTWMRASVGPVLAYRGWEAITPFFFPRLDYIWGTFGLEEIVQDLEGNEQKDLKGKALFGLGLGTDFDISPRLCLRGEAAVYPRGGGTDFSIMIRTLYSF